MALLAFSRKLDRFRSSISRVRWPVCSIIVTYASVERARETAKPAFSIVPNGSQ